MQFRSWARGEGELYSRKAARGRDARSGELNRKRQRTGNDFTAKNCRHGRVQSSALNDQLLALARSFRVSHLLPWPHDILPVVLLCKVIGHRHPS